MIPYPNSQKLVALMAFYQRNSTIIIPRILQTEPDFMNIFDQFDAYCNATHGTEQYSQQHYVSMFEALEDTRQGVLSTQQVVLRGRKRDGPFCIHMGLFQPYCLCLKLKFAPFCTHILFSPLANGNIHDRNWTLRPSTNQRNVSATKRGEFLQQS